MLLVTFDASVASADREAFLALARRAVPPTLAEPGCITYDVLADIDDPNRIVWVEQWRDVVAFDAHQSSEHVKQFLADATPLLLDGRLVIHDVSGTREVDMSGGGSIR